MERAYGRYSITSGIPLNEKSDPIYKEDLFKIGEHYINIGTLQSIERRAVISLTFAAVGRSGEPCKYSD
jgi:hypothetical protein